MKIKIVLLFTLSLISFTVLSQERSYTDYIADENGNRLSGITVRVRGGHVSTRTNSNGVFTLKASIGDVIELSKNGKIINSYVYDGSPHYEVEDQSYELTSKSRISKSNRFNSLLDSANYFIKSDPFKSISFIENALKITSNTRGNSTNISKAYEVLGDIYTHLKQYDLASNNYEISLKNKSDKTVQIKLAKSYSSIGAIEKSNEILNRLISQKLTVENNIEVYTLFGNNFQVSNETDKAILNISKALALAKEHSISDKISELNSKLGALYVLKGEVDKAQLYFKSTIDESKNEPLNKRAMVTNAVANQYRSQKDFDKEIELKKQTLQELNDADINEVSIPEKDEIISTQQLNLDIGNAYVKKDSLSKAIDYFEKSKVGADKFKDFETKKEAVKQLSEAYKNIGDYDKALNSYQEYVALVDLLYKKKEKEIEDAVTLSKNLVEKQNRINSLEKDRELLESKYQLFESEEKITAENYKRQKLIIYFLSFGLLLLLLAIYFMYRSNKERRLSNNLLALKSLRSQMNPHFIFNALNSVNSFIAQNDERTANRYLSDFSQLMRNVLDNSEKDFIPLSKEIELLELYIKLEHSRFTDKFDYTIQIDETVKISEFQIPPMLLQPYIENAVWHGLRYKKEKGILNVSILPNTEDSIHIEISDTGIGRKKSKELKTANQQKRHSKGMDNIKKRVSILNEMYSDKIAVSIEDLNADTTGTKVVLTLKKD